MKRLALLLVILADPAQAGADDSWQAAVAATRELARQLDYLQRALATIPSTDASDFYKGLDEANLDLISFQLQLKRKESSENLLIAFENFDAKLHRLLGVLRNFEKWSPALAAVDSRVRAADHDLHFALAGSNDKQQGAVLQRQTLALLARCENLDNMVRYVFAERPPLQPWLADLATTRLAIKQLQQLQDSSAPLARLKDQFGLVDRAWQKLVERVKSLPDNQDVIIRSDAAQIDQTLARLAQAMGINRPATLRDPLAF